MANKEKLKGNQNFMVYTDEPQPVLLGVTHNLDRHGMLLISLERIMPHSEVDILVATPDGLYPVTCMVEWSNVYTDDDSTQTLYALEMRMVKAPASFYNFIAYLRYEHIRADLPACTQ